MLQMHVYMYHRQQYTGHMHAMADINASCCPVKLLTGRLDIVSEYPLKIVSCAVLHVVSCIVVTLATLQSCHSQFEQNDKGLCAADPVCGLTVFLCKQHLPTPGVHTADT